MQCVEGYGAVVSLAQLALAVKVIDEHPRHGLVPNIHLRNAGCQT